MDKIIFDLEKYLKQVLGIEQFKIKKTGLNNVPFLLLDLYDFYESKFLKSKILLMFLKQGGGVAVSALKKHLNIIKQKTDLEVVLLCEQIDSYTRKDLIQNNIPFIVAGNQLYLPMLGMDLREHYRKEIVKAKKLTPAAQAMLIYCISNSLTKPYTASELSEKLGYSCMTMTRAITEVVGVNLATDQKKWKERFVQLAETGKSLWDKACKYMVNPIKKEIKTNNLPDGKKYYHAGLNALSEYTMLNPPEYSTLAVSKDDWLKIKDNVQDIGKNADCKYRLQIWNYAPGLFAKNDIVDRFSLYLSLKDNEDERVEQALEKMMENDKW